MIVMSTRDPPLMSLASPQCNWNAQKSQTIMRVHGCIGIISVLSASSMTDLLYICIGFTHMQCPLQLVIELFYHAWKYFPILPNASQYLSKIMFFC